MEGLHINGMVGVRQQGAKWKVGGTPKPLPHNGLYASARSRTPSPVLVYTPGSRAQTLIPEVMLEEGALWAMGVPATEPRADSQAPEIARVWTTWPAAGPPTHDEGSKRSSGGGPRSQHDGAKEARAEGGVDESEDGPTALGHKKRTRLGKLPPQQRRRAIKRIRRREAEAAARGDATGSAAGSSS
eukprot:CAMPEP_0170202692 /NCGR_PEP_ID=MMETSP0116_2-20130129/834_1 /TAXON_ID=400756 /ORGANISM="Durinskia baltica, Strain CSIRO CS-38" /LENGTH=185 /DNA_ID=CAMNT_0010452971 /DNA_START=36 /DNA_END=593 /DNA_ORIENTATION=-